MKIFECGCRWIYRLAGLTSLLLARCKSSEAGVANLAKRGETLCVVAEKDEVKK